MSTAGKVLTVLIMLVMVVWLVMMSAVTQLNVNYGMKLKAQQEELEKVTKAAADTNIEYLQLTEKARREQDATDFDVRLKLRDISSKEHSLTSAEERLSRVKINLAIYEDAAAKGKVNLENREAEKVRGEEAKAKLLDEIAKSQALNAQLKAELAQLQDEFKQILARNSAKVKTPVGRPVGVQSGPSS